MQFSPRAVLNGLLFVVASFCCSTFSFASDDFDEKLAEAISKFEEKREKADERVVELIEKQAKKFQRGRMDEATRAELQRRFYAAILEFQRSREFPADGTFGDIQFQYYRLLHRAFEPIILLMEKEIAQANRQNEVQRAGGLVDKRQRLMKDLMNVDPMTAGTAWKGTLFNTSGATIPYHLHVREHSPTGFFGGNVEDNAGVQGHWRYKISGKTSGLRVRFQMTESLRGGFTQVVGDGYLAGNTLIAKLDQSVKNKRKGSVLIVLRR